METLESWRRTTKPNFGQSSASTYCVEASREDEVVLHAKRRSLQRRKFRSKKREDRWSNSCHRIDLKDWPSNLPLPSTTPPLLLHQGVFSPACADKEQGVRCSKRCQEIFNSDWKTPWDLSLDETALSTDVGFTTSTTSGLSWDYDDLGSNSINEAGLSEPSSASTEAFTPVASQTGKSRNVIICEDRLTTWHKEESSPAFFLLALLIILLITGFLSSSSALFPGLLLRGGGEREEIPPNQPQEIASDQPPSAGGGQHWFLPWSGALPALREPLQDMSQLTSSELTAGQCISHYVLNSPYETPLVPLREALAVGGNINLVLDMKDSNGTLSVEHPAASPKDSATEMQWTTYGVDRRKTTPLRLTVFSVGAAVSIYAWQWY